MEERCKQIKGCTTVKHWSISISVPVLATFSSTEFIVSELIDPVSFITQLTSVVK